MTANNISIEQQTPPFRRFLLAGLVAGLTAIVVNNLIYLTLTVIGDVTWVGMVALFILVASLLPNLVGSLVYFALTSLTSRARLIFTIGIIVFVLVSILPHLGIGPAPSEALSVLPEGFDVITIPLHLVFGLTAVTVMPYLASRQ